MSKAIYICSQAFPSMTISRQAKPKGVQGFHIIILSVQALCSHSSFNFMLSKDIFGRALLTLSLAKLPFLVHTKYLAIEHGLPPFIPTARESRIWLENMYITSILISREQNRPTPHLNVPPKRGAVPQCHFKRHLAVIEPSFTNTQEQITLCTYWEKSALDVNEQRNAKTSKMPDMCNWHLRQARMEEKSNKVSSRLDWCLITALKNV